MSKVRTKFRVAAVTTSDIGQGRKFTEIRLIPIWAGADADGKNACIENRTLSDATPSGEIKLGIANELAAGHFEACQDWFVDFTPA